jgi:hypothetical protein
MSNNPWTQRLSEASTAVTAIDREQRQHPPAPTDSPHPQEDTTFRHREA